MTFAKLILPLALSLSVSTAALAQDKPAGAAAPAGAKAYFISPKDGETVSSPVVVRFGLKGMGIAPAGVDFENTGHHHVLVDLDAVNADSPIMKDYLPTEKPNILHFGKGQSEAEIKLEPGKHTLQMVLGDTDHHPHTPPVFSERITITVK
ncbi:MAG: DUF4399 domain-containing protein [Rhodospirillaceae bacterium]|nr:DUF4399 domain-containing protein [Rhodospirillaceae bacterium]